ncbi:MAG: hypothetical protein U9R53_03390 [Chloroflexota bacterium]|nr:hypothetical protein [Chloroflexota bacterium]
METKISNIKPEPSKHASYLRHRRQIVWQIWIPIGVGGLLVLAAAAIMILPVAGIDTGVDISHGEDASLIWMILPMLFLAVIVTLFLVELIVLVAKILKMLPQYTSIGQHYAALIAENVKFWSKRIASPLIVIKSRLASMKAIVTSLLGHSNR